MLSAKDRLVQFYDARAETYDTEDPAFHNRLAADFVAWAASYLPPSLVPAEDAAPPPTPPPFSPYAPGTLRHLDLCCGTGLVTFASLARFGTNATIHGVDFSPLSLDVARAKCPSRTSTVHFHCADVSEGVAKELDAEFGVHEFDLITCCSGFALLPLKNREDRTWMVEQWYERLAPEGVLIFDVPAPGTRCFTAEMHNALREHCGFDGDDPRGWIVDEGSVEDLLVDSGFDEDFCYVFESETYKKVEVELSGLEEMWDRMVVIPYFAGGIEGVDEGRIAKAKENFVERLKKLEKDGKVVDEYRLLIAVGRKKAEDDEDNMLE